MAGSFRNSHVALLEDGCNSGCGPGLRNGTLVQTALAQFSRPLTSWSPLSAYSFPELRWYRVNPTSFIPCQFPGCFNDFGLRHRAGVDGQDFAKRAQLDCWRRRSYRPVNLFQILSIRLCSIFTAYKMPVASRSRPCAGAKPFLSLRTSPQAPLARSRSSQSERSY